MSLPEDQEQHNVQLQRIVTRLLNSSIYPALDGGLKRAISILNGYSELRSASQVNRILKEIRAANEKQYIDAWAAVTEALEESAEYEAGYYARLMQTYGSASLSVPAGKKVIDYATKALMSLGDGSPQTGTWKQFIDGNISATTREYDSIIKSGYVRGQTIKEVADNLKRVSEGKVKGWAESLARTGMSHYSARAHEAMANDNRDIIKKKYLLVTFDNRTSFICMRYGTSKDNPWDLDDEKAPVLPLHYNERSIYIYLVEGQDEPSGIRAAVGGQGGKQAKEIYEKRKQRLRTKSKVTHRGRKDSSLFDVERVRSSTLYDQWFARQPAWFQDSTLGPSRGRLYRQGGFELRQFTDMTGRELTLRELREIDSRAFELAGFD